MKQRKTGTYGLIRCVYRYRNPAECKHFHSIYYEDLYNEINKRIRQVAKGIDNGELMSNFRKQASRQIKFDILKAEKMKLVNRMEILAKIIRKLYEDFAGDLLDSENYHIMLSEYSKEQKQLSQRISVIQNELEKKDNFTDGLQKLGEVLHEFLKIDRLTTTLLNQIIERIEIGHPVKLNGTKQQEIRIIYRFIGTTL
ncbi:MAG: DUF4368 domain-containing protein [Saccharofermentanales bacterium]